MVELRMGVTPENLIRAHTICPGDTLVILPQEEQFQPSWECQASVAVKAGKWLVGIKPVIGRNALVQAFIQALALDVQGTEQEPYDPERLRPYVYENRHGRIILTHIMPGQNNFNALKDLRPTLIYMPWFIPGESLTRFLTKLRAGDDEHIDTPLFLTGGTPLR